MAGHLPLVTTDFHVKLVEEFKNNRTLQMAPLFERIRVEGFEGYFQKLPVSEYLMDEEHGKTDKYVLFFYKLTDDQYSYEVHLDEKLNVNEVYLVM